MAELKYVDQVGLKKTLNLLKDHLEETYRTIASSYSKDEVDALLESINKFDVKVVSTLPAASADTMYHIYLVSKGEGKTGYTEHITIRSGEEGAYTYAWEEIGDTEIDLSNYVLKEEGKGLIATAIAEQLSSTAEGLTVSKDLTIGEDLITNGAEHITLATDVTLQDALDAKVNYEDGKGLSTNDLTDELKAVYDSASSTAHEHANFDVLSGINATKVAEWDAKISDVSTGSANGTISVDGEDVAVNGLGSAAYRDYSDFDMSGDAADAEQNAKTYAKNLVLDGLDNPKFDAVGSAAAVESKIPVEGTIVFHETPLEGGFYFEAEDSGYASTDNVIDVLNEMMPVVITSALTDDEVTAAFNEVFD